MNLEVAGLVAHPGSFEYIDLVNLPGQISDVSLITSNREGSAVPLASLIGACSPLNEAKYLTIEADDYSASILLEPVLPHALLIYGFQGTDLPQKMGGPVRFLIPDITACATGGIDQCANVKFVRRISLSAEPGEDTRPTTPRKHEDLHAAEEAH